MANFAQMRQLGRWSRWGWAGAMALTKINIEIFVVAAMGSSLQGMGGLGGGVAGLAVAITRFSEVACWAGRLDMDWAAATVPDSPFSGGGIACSGTQAETTPISP